MAGEALLGAAAPVAIGLGVLGGVASYRSARKARKYDKIAAALEQRAARIQAYRGRVQAAREAMIVGSQLVNQAAQDGTQGSSGAAGASSSVAAQYGASVGAARATEELLNVAARYRQKSGNSAARSQNYAQLGSTLISFGTA